MSDNVPTDARQSVLIIEHDAEVLDLLTQLIVSWGFDAVATRELYEAEEFIRADPPDLIVFDVSRPKNNGLQTVHGWKTDFFTAHIPVIVLLEKRQFRKRMLEIKRGVDDYLIKPPDPIDLHVRIEMALRRSEHQFFASALTRLPGGRVLERQIEARIDAGEPLSVVYLDIDNFKAFNDSYGYMKGDAVLRQTAHVITTAVKRFGSINDFVGHIGGDDFLVVTTPDHDEAIAREIVMEFDRLIPWHYTADDRQTGGIRVRNRQGQQEDVPLTTISAAVVSNAQRALVSSAQVAGISAEIKSYLKTLRGSHYLIDRRIEEQGHDRRQSSANVSEPVSAAALADQQTPLPPLGQLLLDRQLVSEDQLATALTSHWNTGQRLGQTLVRRGIVSPQALGQLLGEQLDVPFIDLDGCTIEEDALRLLPHDWSRKHRVLPVRHQPEGLEVAMAAPHDIDLVRRTEEIAGCTVQPRLALEEQILSSLHTAHEQQLSAST